LARNKEINLTRPEQVFVSGTLNMVYKIPGYRQQVYVSGMLTMMPKVRGFNRLLKEVSADKLLNRASADKLLKRASSTLAAVQVVFFS